MKKTIIAIALTAPVVLGGCSYDHWNNWIRDCNNMGGEVALSNRSFFADRYECYIDGDIVTVPGYEGE